MWMRKFSYMEAKAITTTVEQVISESAAGDPEKAKVRDLIIKYMAADDSHRGPAAVIRFSRLDKKKLQESVGTARTVPRVRFRFERSLEAKTQRCRGPFRLQLKTGRHILHFCLLT